MNTPISTKDYEILSAYLDGQLKERERKQVEARISTHPELARALDDLRHTQSMLRGLPRRRAPRNFTLSPSMVRTKRAPFAFPYLRLASALASVLFVITLASDLALNISAQNMLSSSSAPSFAPSTAPASVQATQVVSGPAQPPMLGAAPASPGAQQTSPPSPLQKSAGTEPAQANAAAGTADASALSQLSVPATEPTVTPTPEFGIGGGGCEGTCVPEPTGTPGGLMMAAGAPTNALTPPVVNGTPLGLGGGPAPTDSAQAAADQAATEQASVAMTNVPLPSVATPEPLAAESATAEEPSVISRSAQGVTTPPNAQPLPALPQASAPADNNQVTLASAPRAPLAFENIFRILEGSLAVVALLTGLIAYWLHSRMSR